MRKLRTALWSISLLLAVSTLACADEYVWDQVNDSFIPGNLNSIIHIAPIGQEFVPSLDYLEVVEVWACDWSDPPADPPTIVVNIYSDHIGGSLMGTSSAVTLAPAFEGVATFVFEAVALVPGERYVLEVLRLSGGNGAVGTTGGTDTYPFGHIIRWGEPDEGTDLWFREGVIAPTAVQQLTWGRLKQLFE